MLRESILHLATHGALSVLPGRDMVLGEAARREAAPDWVTRADLPRILANAIAARRPFAWLRLGDGEGRFLLRHDPVPGRLPPGGAEAEVDGIWRNWFGSGIDQAPAGRVDEMERLFRRAIADADLLGVTPDIRLAHDHYHYPYCAMIERHVAALPPSMRRLTSANGATDLALDDPFLATLLGRIAWLGAISPHPGLAQRLAAMLGIPQARDWVIPGETRLGHPPGQRHFPDRFDQVMASLAVPAPGAVFLIAGGLLGKIYAGRVRALGGIAIDIGSVVDAWMGINTRGDSLNPLMAQRLPGA